MSFKIPKPNRKNTTIVLSIVIIFLIIFGACIYITRKNNNSHIDNIKHISYYKSVSRKHLKDTNVHQALQHYSIYSPSFKSLMYNNIANFHSPYLDINDEKDNMSYQGLLFDHHIIQCESLEFSSNGSDGNSKNESTYQNLTYTEIKHGVIDSSEFITNHSTPKTLTIIPTATKSPIHKITYKLSNVKYNHHNHKNYTKLILRPIKIVKNKDTHLKLSHIHKDLILTENEKIQK